MSDFGKQVRRLGVPVATRSLPYRANEHLTIARFRHGDAEVETVDGPMLPVVIDLSDSQRVERLAGGVVTCRPSYVGAITVIDPTVPTRLAIRGCADVLKFSISRKMIAEVAGRTTAPVIRPRFHEPDPKLERCALMALSAVRNGDVDGLLVECLAHELARGVVGRDYDRYRSTRGRISPQGLRQVQALINERLAQPVVTSLNLHALAAAAGVSVYHFARAFRSTVGVTPYAYVLQRRLELGRTLLARPGSTIAEISYRVGFKAPSHFVARFREHMGITPGAFRKALWD